jgi:hypothetical protein
LAEVIWKTATYQAANFAMGVPAGIATINSALMDSASLP